MTNAHLKMPCAGSTANTGHAKENGYRPDIPRQTINQLMKRSDAPGLKNFGLWISLLLASGGRIVCVGDVVGRSRVFRVRHDLLFKRRTLA